MRRDSVKLVKLDSCHGKYSLEFVLDSDVRCSVRVLTGVKEDAVSSSIRDSTVKQFNYPAGNVLLCSGEGRAGRIINSQ